MRIPGSFRGVTALVFFAGAAVGQVQINDGQTLTEADLNAGVFMGQPFTLGPGTTFDVNSGGVVWTLGAPGLAFDFLGSAVRVNSGGTLRSFLLDRSEVTGLLIDVYEGGEVGSHFQAGAGCEVDVWGGSVGSFLAAKDGCVVRIHGGEVGGSLAALGGSDVLVTGGSHGSGFTVYDGGSLTVERGVFAAAPRVRSGGAMVARGGSLGRGIRVADGGSLTLEGGEFELDGAPVAALPGGMPAGSTLAGVLRDGSVLVLAEAMGDAIAPGTITLVETELPPIDTTPMVVMDGDGPAIGLRAGQTLTVTGAGALRDRFEMIGATLIVEDGGFGGDGLEAAGSDVRVLGDGPGHIGALGDGAFLLACDVLVDGGVVGDDGQMPQGGTVELREGTIGENWTLHGVDVHVPPQAEGRTGNGQPPQPTQFIGDAFVLRDGSTMVVEAGVIGDGLSVLSGSSLVATGGQFGSLRADGGGSITLEGVVTGTLRVYAGSLEALVGGSFGTIFGYDGASIAIRGGVLRGRLDAESASSLTLSGGEFTDDDLAEYTGEGAAFAGTLADGSVVVFSAISGDSLPAGTILHEVALEPADLSPIVVQDIDDAPVGGLRPGQSMTLLEGGEITRNYVALNAAIEVNGGVFRDNLKLYGASLHVSEGGVWDYLYAIESDVLVEGGEIAISTSLGQQRVYLVRSTFDMVGGRIGSGIYALDSALHVGGAELSDIELVQSQLVIDGGQIESLELSHSDAELKLGEVGGDVVVGSDSTLRVFGGSLGGSVGVRDNGALGLLVRGATLAGNPVGLIEGLPVEITARGGELLVVELAGGAVIDIELNNQELGNNRDFVYPQGTLTLTLGGAACFADVSGSGVVDFADLNKVLSQYGLVGFGYAADINDDGVVGFDDLLEVLVLFGEECG